MSILASACAICTQCARSAHAVQTLSLWGMLCTQCPHSAQLSPSITTQTLVLALLWRFVVPLLLLVHSGYGIVELSSIFTHVYPGGGGDSAGPRTPTTPPPPKGHAPVTRGRMRAQFPLPHAPPQGASGQQLVVKGRGENWLARGGGGGVVGAPRRRGGGSGNGAPVTEPLVKYQSPRREVVRSSAGLGVVYPPFFGVIHVAYPKAWCNNL